MEKIRKMKKLLSLCLSALIIISMFSITKISADVKNPNPQLEQFSSIDAIRNSLKLVWNDEFGGEIGCGAPREALVTTNGFDKDGNPTSDEVRATAKWAHERYRDGTPKTRNGQLQHYVGEDGRNSWTEDGVLYLDWHGAAGECPYSTQLIGTNYELIFTYETT